MILCRYYLYISITVGKIKQILGPLMLHLPGSQKQNVCFLCLNSWANRIYEEWKYFLGYLFWNHIKTRLSSHLVVLFSSSLFMITEDLRICLNQLKYRVLEQMMFTHTHTHTLLSAMMPAMIKFVTPCGLRYPHVMCWRTSFFSCCPAD